MVTQRPPNESPLSPTSFPFNVSTFNEKCLLPMMNSCLHHSAHYGLCIRNSTLCKGLCPWRFVSGRNIKYAYRNRSFFQSLSAGNYARSSKSRCSRLQQRVSFYETSSQSVSESGPLHILRHVQDSAGMTSL